MGNVMQRSHVTSAKSPRGLRPGAQRVWLRVSSLPLLALIISLSSLKTTAETDNGIQISARPVGEVSLVLGRAYIERDEARVLIEAGARSAWVTECSPKPVAMSTSALSMTHW